MQHATRNTRHSTRDTATRDILCRYSLACLLASDPTQPPPYKRLLQQKLGYTVMIHGTVDDTTARSLKVRRPSVLAFLSFHTWYVIW
jgi:hypothetical protein